MHLIGSAGVGPVIRALVSDRRDALRLARLLHHLNANVGAGSVGDLPMDE
jgi:hypothetical protein